MNEQLAGAASFAGTPSVVGQRLHAVLDAERVADDLRRYFAIGLPPGAGVFTGGRFEHLGRRRPSAGREQVHRGGPDSRADPVGHRPRPRRP